MKSVFVSVVLLVIGCEMCVAQAKEEIKRIEEKLVITGALKKNKNESKEEKKAERNLLELFVKKVNKEELPEGEDRTFLEERERYRKIRKEMDKLEYELEEIEAPMYQAMLKSYGLTSDVMKDILKKKEEAHKKFREGMGKDYERYMYSWGKPYVMLPPELDILHERCKEITVTVCKERVCIDEPISLAVHDIYADNDSDGAFTSISITDGQFGYEDDVYGYSEWNLTYHRYSRVHEGTIRIKSSAELVEPAKVRKVGVDFEPLLDWRDWPKSNGVFAVGGYRPFLGCPRSRGKGYMWITLRVYRKLPGESWVKLTDYTELYKQTGWIASRISQAHAYPPARSLDLYEDYPAGTQFSIEVDLSYEIKGNGVEGCASADYNLEVKPYMNLEACTMEYPEYVTISVGD